MTPPARATAQGPSPSSQQGAASQRSRACLSGANTSEAGRRRRKAGKVSEWQERWTSRAAAAGVRAGRGLGPGTDQLRAVARTTNPELSDGVAAGGKEVRRGRGSHLGGCFNYRLSAPAHSVRERNHRPKKSRVVELPG